MTQSIRFWGGSIQLSQKIVRIRQEMTSHCDNCQVSNLCRKTRMFYRWNQLEVVNSTQEEYLPCDLQMTSMLGLRWTNAGIRYDFIFSSPPYITDASLKWTFWRSDTCTLILKKFWNMFFLFTQNLHYIKTMPIMKSTGKNSTIKQLFRKVHQ